MSKVWTEIEVSSIELRDGKTTLVGRFGQFELQITLNRQVDYNCSVNEIKTEVHGLLERTFLDAREAALADEW